jgi:hypothetical protein
VFRPDCFSEAGTIPSSTFARGCAKQLSEDFLRRRILFAPGPCHRASLCRSSESVPVGRIALTRWCVKTPHTPGGCPPFLGIDVLASLPFSGLHAVADRQPSTTFAPPARENLTAVLCRHASPESVGVFPLAPMRLVRAFHVDTPLRIVAVCKAF